MSVVTYNGIQIPYAFITSFKQEAVGDEESNTDWVYSKYDIMVQGVLNFNYLNVIAPALVGHTTNPADIMAYIHHGLMQRRKTLSVSFNGVELIPSVTSNPGSVDVRNGPIPQNCVLTRLTNTSYLITYHIIAHYWVNYNSNPGSSPINTPLQGNPVASNRWTETVDIDQQNYTVRTRTGKYVIRSDNSEGKIADEYRSAMAVLSIPTGFVRESASYTIDPSGLGISYTVRDKEVFKKPPDPAFRAEGTYSETGLVNGVQRFGMMRVKLYGSAITNQVDLVNVALAVATSKLHNRREQLKAGRFADPNTFNIVREARVTIGLYDNWVEVYIRSFIPAFPGMKNGMPAFQNMDTFTPRSDDTTYVPPHQDRGSAGLLLQAAAYYDPSILGTSLSPSSIRKPSPVSSLGDSNIQTNNAGQLQVGQAGKSVER